MQSKKGKSFVTFCGHKYVQPLPGNQVSTICSGDLWRKISSLQMSPFSSSFPCITCWVWCHMAWDEEQHPLAIWCWLSQLCPFPTPCAPPGCSLVRWSERQKSSWLCVSATQQHPKHPCVITALFITNSKHKDIQIPSKKLTVSQPKSVQVH